MKTTLALMLLATVALAAPEKQKPETGARRTKNSSNK